MQWKASQPKYRDGEMLSEHTPYKGDIGSCHLLIKDIFYFESVAFHTPEDDSTPSNIYLALTGLTYQE